MAPLTKWITSLLHGLSARWEPIHVLSALCVGHTRVGSVSEQREGRVPCGMPIQLL